MVDINAMPMPAGVGFYCVILDWHVKVILHNVRALKNEI